MRKDDENGEMKGKHGRVDSRKVLGGNIPVLVSSHRPAEEESFKLHGAEYASWRSPPGDHEREDAGLARVVEPEEAVKERHLL